MTLQIGRVGTDITLYDPAQWSRNGTTVTLSGDLGIGVTTLADVVTLTEQMLGLVDNPDEPYVACTWTQEPWFDGYYRVTSVSVNTIPVSLNVGVFPYSITLSKVADGASPTIDVTLLGALRTNGNSVTTGRADSWAPSAMQGGFGTVAGTIVAYNQTGTAQSRTTETGAVISVQTTGTSTVTNSYAKFDVTPANYYNGTCTIRSGTTLRRVMGARMKTLPTNWEISNGLIRITPAALATIQMELYDGAAWEDARTFHFVAGTSASSNAHALSSGWGDISVLRNSPECVSIRLVASYPGGNANSQLQTDITLQRGRYVADITFVDISNSANSSKGIARTSAEAATAITGAIRATSNDASGNRFVMGTSQATTNDLTQGGTRTTSSVSSANILLGYEFNGSSSAAPNTAQNVVDEWYYSLEERMAPRVR